ncbi:MAG: hypothetical protein K6C94_03140 [Candidatus Gastranaerophilales bacterium]|nr:hypothetical protein [Candidatus Gastranaerophilales bacterium]
MSILSRYYYKKYMQRTLSNRMANAYGNADLNDITQEVNEVRSALSAINESYESAASGFFASSGQLIQVTE